MVWRLLPFLVMILLSSCTLRNLNTESALNPSEREALDAEAAELREEGRHLRETAEFYKALECQSQALEISLRLGDSLSIIHDYNQLGTTFRRVGHLEPAVVYHLQALSYAEQLSDTSAQAVKSLVVSLNGLGNTYLTFGDNEQAELCFRRALRGESQLQSHLGMAINYANLGSIKDRFADYDSAQWYYSKSLEENVLANSTLGQGLCHVYLGRSLQRENQLQAAEAEFLIARDLLLHDPDRWHSVEPVLALGENLLLQGRVSEAIAYASEAMQCARELNSYEILQQSTSLLARLYERQGNTREALTLYKESEAWRDSLNIADNNNGIRNAIIAYTVRQHQHEMQQLQDVMEERSYKNQVISVIEAALLLLSFIVLLLMWFTIKGRKKRIQALKRIDNLRNTFLRNITHEFRTPLTVILGLSNQLKEEGLDHSHRLHFLNCIEQQGKTLLELVNELLGLSKLMAGYDNGKWCHGDIVAFCRMTLAGYSDFASLHNISLSIDATQEHIEMDFVPEYYSKILNNLLGNAFKYTTAENSVTVQLTTQSGFLDFRVADTGRGINPEDLPHIFELFYQGEESNLQASTGVGLAFVKQMVQHMGGTIGIEPNQPHGTIVRMQLPVRCPNHSAEIQPWSIQQALERDLSPIHHSLRQDQNQPVSLPTNNDESMPLVLVVEDNHDVAEYISLVLQTRYRVELANDGFDAINKAGRCLPDAIITDLMMPGMDGYQLCQSIRQSQVLSDLPIVILSARSEDSDRVRGYEDGADAYLLKPFNPNELMALLDRLLIQRSQMRNYVRQLISNTQQNQAQDQLKASSDRKAEETAFVQRLHEVVSRQMSIGNLQLENIANLMNISKSMLSRQVKQIAGCSAAAYILQLRLEHARQLLVIPEKSIGEISLDCGFDDLSYFSRVFRQNYNQTPTQYRSSLINN